VTFYTRVPDLDAAIRRARALGSRLLVPPTRHGDTVIAVVSDPEGHRVGVCSFGLAMRGADPKRRSAARALRRRLTKPRQSPRRRADHSERSWSRAPG
jgi:hypothetical protein